MSGVKYPDRAAPVETPGQRICITCVHSSNRVDACSRLPTNHRKAALTRRLPGFRRQCGSASGRDGSYVEAFFFLTGLGWRAGLLLICMFPLAAWVYGELPPTSPRELLFALMLVAAIGAGLLWQHFAKDREEP